MGGRWLGSTLVLAELHGHLIRRIDPARARKVIEALQADPLYEWHDCTTQLMQAALLRWLARFPDQRFSLTDAVTFELMRLNRLTRAFAYDQHFVTAGFELLE